MTNSVHELFQVMTGAEAARQARTDEYVVVGDASEPVSPPTRGFGDEAIRELAEHDGRVAAARAAYYEAVRSSLQ